MPHLKPSSSEGGIGSTQSVKETVDEELRALEAEANRSIKLDKEAAAEASRRYKAVKTLRALATRNSIESVGLRPNLKLLVPPPDAVVEQPLESPSKRRKIMGPSLIPLALRIQHPSLTAAAAAPSMPSAPRMPTRPARSAPLGRLRVAEYIRPLLSEDLDSWRALHLPQRFDLLTSLFRVTELAIEVGKYLRPRDIVNLFSISRAFHESVSTHLASSTTAWARHNAPGVHKIFSFNMYARFCTTDPGGRTFTFGAEKVVFPGATKSADGAAAAAARAGSAAPVAAAAAPPVPQAAATAAAKRRNGAGGGGVKGSTPAVTSGPATSRQVPGLRWYQLVVFRERAITDILACLARAGHRTPPLMKATLAKVWLIMDVATNRGREALVRHKPFMTHFDVYNATMFFTKLDLRFNDPLYQGGGTTLRHLMMGQRDGFMTLWRLLTRREFAFDLTKLVQLKLRYNYAPTQGQVDHGLPVFGVPLVELGAGHLEGWGRGTVHLLRPDELIPMEAMRRRLPLESCSMWFALWGNVDWQTGRNLVPSAKELALYRPEDESDLGPLTDDEFEPVHARIKQWADLPREERRAYRRAIEEAKMQSLALPDVALAEGEKSCSDDDDQMWFSDTPCPADPSNKLPADAAARSTAFSIAHRNQVDNNNNRRSELTMALADPDLDSDDDRCLRALGNVPHTDADLAFDWPAYIAARRSRNGRALGRNVRPGRPYPMPPGYSDDDDDDGDDGVVGGTCLGVYDNTHDPMAEDGDDADVEETDDDLEDYTNQDHGWFSC